MTDSKMDKAEQMIHEGKTIVQICDELQVGWKEVSDHLRSVDARSWQGAKQVITRRLKSLVKENDRDAREKLVDEASMWINYLYYDGKRLSRQVDRARKALDGQVGR